MKKTLLFFVVAIQLLAFQAYGDTVVGIHGFITDWRSLKPIEHVLGRMGLNVYLWNYPCRRKFISEHGCDLVRTLQEIAGNCPGRPIHFVTHSTGALVLRSALSAPNCPMEAKMGRAVLLAPPNQGCGLARHFRDCPPFQFAMGDKTGWELLNYGPCEMAQLGMFPSSMDVLVIAGTKGGTRTWFCEPNDGFLTVEETWLNTPFWVQSYPVTHGDMMKNHCVLCCMKKFIRGWYCDPKSACTDSGSCGKTIIDCPKQVDVCYPEAGECFHSSELEQP